jgi:hypothetical protein
MVPDMMYIKAITPTGRVRYRITPRLFGWVIGPAVIKEVEITVVRGWMNPYNTNTTEETIWRKETREDREVLVNV